MQIQERPPVSEQASALETLVTQQQSLLLQLGHQMQSLQQQLTVLQSEVRQQPTLGLSNGRDYIIIERDKNILWHRFENEEPVPITAKVLKGYVRRVVFVDKEYPKLHVFIEGDREYVLVTGFETYFARELLAAIGTLKPEDLAYPVIIKPDTGSDEGKSKHKPVFCNVIHRGRTVKPGTLRNQDIHQLYKRAEAILAQAQSELGKCDRAVTSSSNRLQSIGEQAGRKVTQFSRPQPAQAIAAPELPVVPAASSSTSVAPPAPTLQTAVDWKKVCSDLNISKQQLMAVARRLKLPHGKLNRSQSAQLYQAVYEQYGEVAG